MKSPFIIVQDFLSPKMCEKIVDDNRITQPDLDTEGDPIKTEHFILKSEAVIAEAFRELVPTIEQQYDCAYRGLEQPVIQYFPENAKNPAVPPGCENSRYSRKKWIKYKDVDLVGFIWLKDFNDRVPLDIQYEVFGGKLEFPVYNFSLVPQRGTLVLFPAGPHFINVISPIMVGDLYQIKLNVCISPKDGGMWFYQPQDYGGTWQEWLEAYM